MSVLNAETNLNKQKAPDFMLGASLIRVNFGH